MNRRSPAGRFMCERSNSWETHITGIKFCTCWIEQFNLVSLSWQEKILTNVSKSSEGEYVGSKRHLRRQRVRLIIPMEGGSRIGTGGWGRSGPSISAEFYLGHYRWGERLGVGTLGEVNEAEHTLTGHKVGIKTLDQRNIQFMDIKEKLIQEIKILRLFKHPHIIRVYEVIETPTDIFVVMEYMKNGDLSDYIVEKGGLQEAEARRLFQQIVSAVEYCHRNMVVHRDLTPENLWLDSNWNVKIADFGLSNIMPDDHFLSCGSVNYAAPEVISGKVWAGPEVDVWSCGVILYALLCGTLPSDDENIPNQKIKGGSYTLLSHLSPGARDLIHGMLLVDPLKRVSIPEIRQHPWFQDYLPRYLAVPPTVANQQTTEIDEDVLQAVVHMGFDKSHVMESLRNRVQNQATASYHLTLDNRLPISYGCFGASSSNRDTDGGIESLA